MDENLFRGMKKFACSLCRIMAALEALFNIFQYQP
jgi:hypothetical protein